MKTYYNTIKIKIGQTMKAQTVYINFYQQTPMKLEKIAKVSQNQCKAGKYGIFMLWILHSINDDTQGQVDLE